MNPEVEDSSSTIIPNPVRTMSDMDPTVDEDMADLADYAFDNGYEEYVQMPKRLRASPAMADMEEMKELMAQWIMTAQHPFSIVEEEGFNMLMGRGMGRPDWEPISETTIKRYCVHIFEKERENLKSELKNVNKISLTTDYWRSENGKIQCMVLTGHWIDKDWRLHKRVLNFIDLPPPVKGLDIANSIWRCLENWGIVGKIHTLCMDNDMVNDYVIDNLKVYIESRKKLLCGGKLFHARCFAHIMNMIGRDGLSVINDIIDVIRGGIEWVRYSDVALKIFGEVVKRLDLLEGKLIVDNEMTWDSTYEMLVAAIKFKDVFSRFAEVDPLFNCCPSEEEWVKVEKVCSVFEVCWDAMSIISRSKYPTSNLFFFEVSNVKLFLDSMVCDDDYFIKDMVEKMVKFDKYWEECNLLFAIGVVLDPRCKMRALEFMFPKLYSAEKSNVEIEFVRTMLSELYSEYLEVHNEKVESSEDRDGRIGNEIKSGWSEWMDHVRSLRKVKPEKSELDMYLEENCLVLGDESYGDFDVLEWWKVNESRFEVLAIMAKEILTIPVTSVACEGIFSAGNRVIDDYYDSLTSDTVQVLVCGGDWLRKGFGIKEKNENDKVEIVVLPVDDGASKG